MSQNRRNRRKNKGDNQQLSSKITKKDKIFGILAIVLIFLSAVAAVIYFAFANAKIV